MTKSALAHLFTQSNPVAITHQKSPYTLPHLAPPPDLTVLRQKIENIQDLVSKRSCKYAFPAKLLLYTMTAIGNFGEIKLENEQSKIEYRAQLVQLFLHLSQIEYRLKQRRHIWLPSYARNTRKMLQDQSLVAQKLQRALFVRLHLVKEVSEDPLRC